MHPGPITFIHAVPALLAGALAIRAWRWRDVRGNRYMALLMSAVCLWSVTEAMVHVVPERTWMQFWSAVSYLGSQTTPVLFFLFVLSFAGLEARVGRPWRRALFIVPALSIALAATNHLHGLVWSSITPTESAYGTTGVFGHGPWFFFMIAYGYLFIIIAIVMLARAIYRFHHLYSMQTRLLLFGSLVPFAGNMVYVAGFSPVPGLDITPAAFSVTGLLLSLAVSRFHFLSSDPVSRDSLLSIMKDGILALTADSRIVEINPAAMKMLGLDGEAPLGETAEKMLTNSPELLAAIAPGTISATLISLGDRYVELDINPLPARPGETPGRMLVLRDVTSRRRTEEALRASEERFRDLVDLLPIGIYESDSEARITYVNRAAIDMFGFSSANILPMDFQTIDMLSPAARAKWPLVRRMLATRGIAMNIELEAIRADGTVFPIIINACSIDPDDFLRGTRGVIFDITERKRAEDALSRREARLAAIFENAGAGIDLVNADGRFLRVNKSLADMLGYTVNELEGMYVADITHPEDIRASGETLRALQNGEVDSYQMEKRYLRRDGSVIWISLSVTPIRNTDGSTEAIIGMISNITERKRMEEAVQNERAFLRQVIDAVPGFIAVKNRMGRFELANRAIAEAYGTTAEEMIGKTDSDYSPNGDEVEHFLSDDREVMDTLRPKLIPEEKVTFSNGEEHWLSTVKVPLFENDGTSRRVLLVTTDITERRSAEESLREKTDELEKFFSGALDLLCVADTDGYFRRLNAEWEKTLGYTREELPTTGRCSHRRRVRE